MAGKSKCAFGPYNKGKPTIEWYKNRIPQYYCHGLVDMRTEFLLPECEECPIHVDKAQEDYDKYCKEKRNE